MGNIKVALCLSGYLRTIQFNVPTWHKFLLNQKNVEIDIFIHTWNIGNSNIYRPIDNTIRYLQQQFNIKGLVIEPPITFASNELTNSRAGGYIPQNVTSQFYGISKVFEIKANYERANNFKYDCSVRFRPDIHLKSNITFDSNIDYNKVHIPRYGDFAGINDQIAFSNSENMQNYSELFHYIDMYLSQDESLVFCPEILMKHHCDKMELNISRFDLSYQLARNINNLLPENRDREISMGFIKP